MADVGKLITEALEEQKLRDSIRVQIEHFNRNQAALWVIWAQQPGNLPCR